MAYRNLAELLRVQAERLGPKPALRFRKYGLYHDYCWSQYGADALACAAALIDAGVQPGDRVGVFAENRSEWLVADMGILTAAAVNVTPHAPLTARQVQYELADSGTSWLFVSTRDQLDKILQVRGELPALRGIVTFDPVYDLPGDIHSWPSFLQRGRMLLAAPLTPNPSPARGEGRMCHELARREQQLDHDSLATIMYTSGTTGPSKGVMLTHGNLLSNAVAVLEASPAAQTDVCFSWLPFSHIYARTVDHYRAIVAGVPLCLAESVDTLVLNLAEIQPTHMNSVPRFYEKVLASTAAPDPAETGRRLRNIFGPRMEYLCSGGAPLPVPVADAYAAAGLLVLQGYGLTESSPVISFNTKERHRLGSVGPAIPGVDVKIAADGEILTRGPHVMKGYWKKPIETDEAIRDGWLYTGDLGRLDDDGFLFITGRKKEILVLSSGKKVVPAYLEGLLLSDPCIDQVVIHGEGRNFLTALIVPNWPQLRKTLKSDGIAADGSEETLANSTAVYACLERRLAKALADMTKCEQVKKFVILPRPFTVESEELTVSLKLRRRVIFNHHGAVLDTLYQKD